MQLWVGLGNPGPQYAMQRHNVGFMAADTIAEVHGFGPVQKKFLGWMRGWRRRRPVPSKLLPIAQRWGGGPFTEE